MSRQKEMMTVRLRTASRVVAVLLAATIPGVALAVINGAPDFSNECVGSLHDSPGSGLVCSGTLIDESWVLTSAQCALAQPNLFVMGRDWAVDPRVYIVDHIVVHPSWSGTEVFDYAMAHLVDPVPSEPVCVPLTVPEDNLNVGTQLTHVGYGLVSYPSGFTTERHYTVNTVSQVDSTAIMFLTSASGPCLGDQGGPALTAGDQRVAGVVSTIDGTCSQWVIDGRVSAVYESFIVPAILTYSGIFHDGLELGDTSRWSATVGLSRR